MELAGLHRRLETLPVIEQSKGILIGRYGIDPDSAFCLLRRWSSHTNLKLRDISRLIVDAASQGFPQQCALDDLLRRLDTASLVPAGMAAGGVSQSKATTAQSVVFTHAFRAGPVSVEEPTGPGQR